MDISQLLQEAAAAPEKEKTHRTDKFKPVVEQLAEKGYDSKQIKEWFDAKSIRLSLPIITAYRRAHLKRIESTETPVDMFAVPVDMTHAATPIRVRTRTQVSEPVDVIKVNADEISQPTHTLDKNGKVVEIRPANAEIEAGHHLTEEERNPQQ